MSEYPKKGDRVRVVYEGEVTRADDLLQRSFEVDGAFVFPSRGVEFKVLERIYRKGTVAIFPNLPDWPHSRDSSGVWRSPAGTDNSVTDKVVSDAMTVVYEPAS